jgi:hypothetical protein
MFLTQIAASGVTGLDKVFVFVFGHFNIENTHKTLAIRPAGSIHTSWEYGSR